MPSPRDIPTWLRTIINVVAFVGVGATLMGWIQKEFGLVILFLAPVYLTWEIYPWMARQVQRGLLMSLAVFMFGGAALGAGAWLAVSRSAPKPTVVPTPSQGTRDVAPQQPEPATIVGAPSPSKPIAAHPKADDPIGHLSKLGWTIKHEGQFVQFEVASASLPDMSKSAPLFKEMREPFRIYLQSVPSLTGLEELSSVEGCKEIAISASDLLNLDELRGFVHLTKLTISQVPLNTHTELDISALEGLIALKALTLNSSRVTSIDPVRGMVHLSSMNIGGTLVKDLSPISGLTELRMVDVIGSHITDLSPLAASRGLEELGVDGKQVHTIALLSSASKLTQLRLFDQSSFDFTPIGSLSHLETIFIWGPPVIDVSFLRKLPHLLNLQINGAVFGQRSQVIDASAICAFGGPQSLTMSELQLGSLDFISGCTKQLSDLSIRDLPIVSVGEISHMTTLRKLALIRVQVVEISPLLSLSDLRSLSLIGVPARADVISELERRGVKVSNV